MIKKKIFLIFIVILYILIFTIHLYSETGTEASTFEDEFSETSDIVADPLEPYNRLATSFNDKMYFWALEPVSSGYSKIVPEGPRIGIKNFFRNIAFPVRFINSLLQFKFEKAGIETVRFIVNSTIGLAGFGDAANYSLKLEPQDEDFGQTLGFYHIGSLFHIDWPFLGPSNLRDSVGYVVDLFLNPINYIPNLWVVTAIHVFEKINKTSLHLGEYEKLKKESVDYYIQLRDSYEQYRNKEIKE
jgi:phospholipid-binding lipoprotein MlaA